MQKKFNLGQIVFTPMVSERIPMEVIQSSLARHRSGDWGSVCKEDRASNDQALRDGDRLVSAYDHRGSTFWVITEWDRSVTTVLFPEEY